MYPNWFGPCIITNFVGDAKHLKAVTILDLLHNIQKTVAITNVKPYIERENDIASSDSKNDSMQPKTSLIQEKGEGHVSCDNSRIVNDWYHPSYYLDCGEISVDKDAKESDANVDNGDKNIQENQLNETPNPNLSDTTNETIITSPCRVTISSETQTFNYPSESFQEDEILRDQPKDLPSNTDPASQVYIQKFNQPLVDLDLNPDTCNEDPTYIPDKSIQKELNDTIETDQTLNQTDLSIQSDIRPNKVSDRRPGTTQERFHPYNLRDRNPIDDTLLLIDLSEHLIDL